MKIVEVTEILGGGKIKVKDAVGREFTFFTDKDVTRGDYLIIVSGVVVQKTGKPVITTYNV
jgi:hypothetical protein